MAKPSDEQVGGDHYRSMEVQPSYYNQKNGLSWCCGNVVKYVSRKKGDDEKRIEDLKKAIHYIQMELEWEHDVYLVVQETEVPGVVPKKTDWVNPFYAGEGHAKTSGNS